MHVLEKVAKALSRNYGIKVIFQGNQAMTDHKQIILPTLPEDLTEEDEAKVRGFCDHEIGHLKYTDNDFWKSKVRDSDKRIRKMTNLLEDFRIENRLGIDYPGAKVNMERTANIMHNNPETDKSHPVNKLWVEGRRQLCGYRFDDPDLTMDVKTTFGESIFEDIAAMGSTMDAYMLAEKILKHFDENKDEEDDSGKDLDGSEGDSEDFIENEDKGTPDESGCEKGHSEGDWMEPEDIEDSASSNPEPDDVKEPKSEKTESGSEDGKDSEDSESESEDPESEKSDGKSKKSTDTASEDDDEGESKDKSEDEEEDCIRTNADLDGVEGKAESSAGIMQSLEEMDKWKDPMDELKNMVEKLHVDALTARKYIPYATYRDTLAPLPEALDIEEFGKLKNSLGSLNTLRSKMSNMFLAKVASKWVNDKDEGKINCRALARVKTGYKKVFKERRICRDTDTAITFLVDFSGSMGGNKLLNAMRSVVMFLETLKATKIKSEVLGYTTHGEYRIESEGEYLYGRIEPLLTYIIKGFDESYNGRIKKRISYYKNIKLRNNCDPENVKIAYDRLRCRSEKRKILFVLSDGAVANLGNTSIGIKYLKDLVAGITKEGAVEIIGIGLDCNVDHYYPTNIRVNGASLTSSLFLELKKIFKI